MKIFFLLFQFLAIIICSDINTCPEISSSLSSNQTQIIEIISNNISILKQKAQACIDILVKNAKFEALDFYLSELSKDGIKYRESLQMSINTMKKTLDEIHNKHRFDEIEYQTVFPAFQWAQSLDEIFIEIKFAHRHDSPGCLEMKNYKVNIDSNEVSFIGYCVLGDVPIKIDFNITTARPINKTMSTHGFGSVGRFQITLKKEKEGTFWEKLLADGSVQPGNMRIWFEMKEKYAEQLKKFEEENEEDEFKKEVEEIEKQIASEKGKKKKRTKRKGSKKANINTNATKIEEGKDEKVEKGEQGEKGEKGEKGDL